MKLRSVPYHFICLIMVQCLCDPIFAADIRKTDPFEIAGNIDEVKSKAENGDKEAQFNLATAFGRGIGVEINHNKAWEWINKAAENGHSEAQYWKGYSFFYGHREKTNRIKALEWFKKAAEQGYKDAIFMMGYILDSKKFPEIERDPKEAVKWFSKAGNKGHAEAAFRLGCKSYFGKDVSKSEKIAMSWFELAKKNGDPAAERYLRDKNTTILQQSCP